MQRDLVERAKRGDHAAFDALASSAFNRLYTTAYRVLRDADRSDDAVQECLIRAWRDVPLLRDVDRFDAWLWRLLMNACYDESRRARRRSKEVTSIPLDHAGPGDAATDLADRDELLRGFQRLSIEQRVVVVMTHYLGMPAREIAEALDIPVGTVQSRLLYAIRSMRATLEADARPARAIAGGQP